jgi:hypothetical protein
MLSAVHVALPSGSYLYSRLELQLHPPEAAPITTGTRRESETKHREYQHFSLGRNTKFLFNLKKKVPFSSCFSSSNFFWLFLSFPFVFF